jgi:beta-aspartyl-peptidase (threonine type)
MKVALLLACTLAACAVSPDRQAAKPSSGKLLIVGGGLDNDTAPVYRALLEAGRGPVLVATAATGPQEDEAVDKTQALLAHDAGTEVIVLRRETGDAQTIDALQRARSVFFTGGDQQRIVDRYPPGPVREAFHAFVQRGGTLGGGSAGCAMLGERMLLGGRSAHALGIPAKDEDGSERVLGPRIGSGMGFLPGVLTDSHFFERDRLGRLCAALVQGPDKLGLGVGEDAAVEVDLAARTVRGLTWSESLLIDARFARAEGGRWGPFVAQLVGEGEALALGGLCDQPPEVLAEAAATRIPVVEPGQNRQLSSWRLFRRARDGQELFEWHSDGWSVRARGLGDGRRVLFEVRR